MNLSESIFCIRLCLTVKMIVKPIIPSGYARVKGTKVDILLPFRYNKSIFYI